MELERTGEVVYKQSPVNIFKQMRLMWRRPHIVLQLFAYKPLDGGSHYDSERLSLLVLSGGLQECAPVDKILVHAVVPDSNASSNEEALRCQLQLKYGQAVEQES